MAREEAAQFSSAYGSSYGGPHTMDHPVMLAPSLPCVSREGAMQQQSQMYMFVPMHHPSMHPQQLAPIGLPIASSAGPCVVAPQMMANPYPQMMMANPYPQPTTGCFYNTTGAFPGSFPGSFPIHASSQNQNPAARRRKRNIPIDGAQQPPEAKKRALSSVRQAIRREREEAMCYRCGYCGRIKVSAISGKRARIRCECGGRHQDGQHRLHGIWKLVRDEKGEPKNTPDEQPAQADPSEQQQPAQADPSEQQQPAQADPSDQQQPAQADPAWQQPTSALISIMGDEERAEKNENDEHFIGEEYDVSKMLNEH